MAIVEVTDYKADKIKGKQRIYGGKFGNELGGTPWMSFDEELVTVDESTGTVFRNQVGSCMVQLTEPAKVLTLRNPLDDSVIGTASYMDVMVMLYSLGRQTQVERDAGGV